MIDLSRNHFELFGVPERFAVDPEALERTYRALQTEVHPDRYATANDTERRLALQMSAHVNEAYRALKDPVDRAQYLLSLHGVETFSGPDSALPYEFLERQLERREAASEAADMRDSAALERLQEDIREEHAALERELAVILDRDSAWSAAPALVREMKFLDKLAADIDAMLGDLEA
jgi:molecular chaperone HscB